MNPPTIKIVYDNGFDDKISVKTTLKGNTINELMDAIKDALKGMGFSEELVDDYFGTCPNGE